MPVRIDPTSTILVNLGLGADGRITNFIVNECAKHMDKYVPMQKGDLADYRIRGNVIIYDQPYARYQYFGIREDGTHAINPANRNRSKHGLATSYWDKKMVSAELGDIIEKAQEKLR